MHDHQHHRHPDEAAAAATAAVDSRPATENRRHAPASEYHHAYWRSPHEDGDGAAGAAEGRGAGESNFPYSFHAPPSGGYGYEYHESQDGVYGGRPYAREPDVQPSMSGWKPLGASAGGYGYGGGVGGGVGRWTGRGAGGGGGGGGASGPGGERDSTDNLALLAKAASEEDGEGGEAK